MSRVYFNLRKSYLLVFHTILNVTNTMQIRIALIYSIAIKSPSFNCLTILSHPTRSITTIRFTCSPQNLNKEKASFRISTLTFTIILIRLYNRLKSNLSVKSKRRLSYFSRYPVVYIYHHARAKQTVEN